jgi:hypothetical protein
MKPTVSSRNSVSSASPAPQRFGRAQAGGPQSADGAREKSSGKRQRDCQADQADVDRGVELHERRAGGREKPFWRA